MHLFLFSLETLIGLPDFVGIIFIFMLGAIIGSFLNVVIYRVPNNKSIVFPNSACPKCENPIQFYDNVPVLSWLILGGKCRKCKNPISIQYPAVELLTGLTFALTAWQIGFTPFLPVALIFVSAIIPLIFIDAEHQLLPDVITKPLLVFSLLVRILFPIFIGAEYFTDIRIAPLTFLQGYPVWLISLVGAIFGGLLGGGSLWLLGEIWWRLRKVEGMGGGDVKMMFAVGALLGWRLTFLTIFIGALTGAIVGIYVMWKDKENGLQSKIPFGIFLGFGAIVSLLFGEQIIAWYIATFIPQ